MIQCIQSYQKNGKIEIYKQTNLAYKKLVENTSTEFAEFFENYLQIGRIYRIDDVLNEFHQLNDLNKNQISQNTFSRALKYWAVTFKKMYLIEEHIKELRCKLFVIDDEDVTFTKWKKTEQFKGLLDIVRIL
ncbi:hypothetical protein MASR1M45_02520 [Candidatus Kapaibacterium sp.]